MSSLTPDVDQDLGDATRWAIERWAAEPPEATIVIEHIPKVDIVSCIEQKDETPAVLQQEEAEEHLGEQGKKTADVSNTTQAKSSKAAVTASPKVDCRRSPRRTTTGTPAPSPTASLVSPRTSQANAVKLATVPKLPGSSPAQSKVPSVQAPTRPLAKAKASADKPEEAKKPDSPKKVESPLKKADTPPKKVDSPAKKADSQGIKADSTAKALLPELVPAATPALDAEEALAAVVDLSAAEEKPETVDQPAAPAVDVGVPLATAVPKQADRSQSRSPGASNRAPSAEKLETKKPADSEVQATAAKSKRVGRSPSPQAPSKVAEGAATEKTAAAPEALAGAKAAPKRAVRSPSPGAKQAVGHVRAEEKQAIEPVATAAKTESGSAAPKAAPKKVNRSPSPSGRKPAAPQARAEEKATLEQKAVAAEKPTAALKLAAAEKPVAAPKRAGRSPSRADLLAAQQKAEQVLPSVATRAQPAKGPTSDELLAKDLEEKRRQAKLLAQKNARHMSKVVSSKANSENMVGPVCSTENVAPAKKVEPRKASPARKVEREPLKEANASADSKVDKAIARRPSGMAISSKRASQVLNAASAEANGQESMPASPSSQAARVPTRAPVPTGTASPRPSVKSTTGSGAKKGFSPPPRGSAAKGTRAAGRMVAKEDATEVEAEAAADSLNVDAVQVAAIAA